MTLLVDRPKVVYTPNSLKRAIADGKMCVIFKGKVYDLTKFIKYHPGGQLAIRHMVGQDATGAVVAFHTQHIIDNRLSRYYSGDYVPVSLDSKPEPVVDITDITDVTESASSSISATSPSSLGASRLIVASGSPVEDDYVRLASDLVDKGFYKPDYLFYIRRLVLFASILFGALWLARSYSTNAWALALSALMLGFTWHGLSFTAHDAGHFSVSTNRTFDNIFGIIIADFIGGLSIGWWKYNHNVHHIVTNDPEHDPDIQHMPLFAVTPRFFDSLYSSFHRRVMEFDIFAKFLVRLQHFLFVPVMTLGRFNLYAQSLNHLLRTKGDDLPRFRNLERIGMCFFWFWYGYLLVYCTIPTWPLRLMYIYLSHASTFILHLQITLSHFAMSTNYPDGGSESWAEKALRTTMNVDCPEWFDWFHGGLQFQIEHHLFPRVPRVHFRRLRPIIKDFCAKHGITYHEYGFLEGNAKVIECLRSVAQQLDLLLKSADPTVRFKQE